MSREIDFIATLRGLPLHPGARGLEDDCAVIEVGPETLILTHDMLVEGTHYRAGADMGDVAWKLVATNLSDLAAKGAQPVGVLIGHMLGHDDQQFVAGLSEALAHYEVPLLGGDTVSGDGSKAHGLTAIGRATHTPVPSRAGAQVGQGIYVTGALGAAMLGFEGDARYAKAYNRPDALLEEGRALAPLVGAMMDISDGLLLDCLRMACASEDVAFELERSAIPVVDPDRLDACIRWGDDYQLLFTADPAIALPVAATRIGWVAAANSAPLWLDRTSLTLADGLGYRHT